MLDRAGPSSVCIPLKFPTISRMIVFSVSPDSITLMWLNNFDPKFRLLTRFDNFDPISDFLRGEERYVWYKTDLLQPERQGRACQTSVGTCWEKVSAGKLQKFVLKQNAAQINKCWKKNQISSSIKLFEKSEREKLKVLKRQEPEESQNNYIWLILRCWGKSSLFCQQKSDAL